MNFEDHRPPHMGSRGSEGSEGMGMRGSGGPESRPNARKEDRLPSEITLLDIKCKIELYENDSI